MKKYRVTIELDTFEFIVSAKDKKEAKEKALNNNINYDPKRMAR